MQLTAIFTPTIERGFVATNPATGTCIQGESVEEAVTSLQEA